VDSRVPEPDPDLARRLTARFGEPARAWVDELPALLARLARQWQLELETPIPRGSVSAVFRCRTGDARRAVIKASPDRDRVAREGAALASWSSPHAPALLAADAEVGALLMEEIEPGTPLVVSGAYPPLDRVAELVRSLHAGTPGPHPPVGERVANLFASSAKLYERSLYLAEVIAPELYERGRRLAARLAEDEVPSVLLHGDLTPSNLLDGGDERGLVAIDPAPCRGDAAFDLVDLLLWQADDVRTVEARAEALAPAIGADAGRMLEWCAAFAGMVALELAESSATAPGLAAAAELASSAPAV
jgi:streptomycin 6-kinase